MKRLILILFLFSGCSTNQSQNTNNYSTLEFSDNLTIEEFMIKLDEYANNSPYPNIDD